MKKYCPLTKDIAFARLDKRLSEEDKMAILKAKDMIEFHFSLGMWIRNTWIYGMKKSVLRIWPKTWVKKSSGMLIVYHQPYSIVTRSI